MGRRFVHHRIDRNGRACRSSLGPLHRAGHDTGNGKIFGAQQDILACRHGRVIGNIGLGAIHQCVDADGAAKGETFSELPAHGHIDDPAGIRGCQFDVTGGRFQGHSAPGSILIFQINGGWIINKGIRGLGKQLNGLIIDITDIIGLSVRKSRQPPFAVTVIDHRITGLKMMIGSKMNFIVIHGN